MAKLHFFYGVMASSKSALLGINAYNLTRQGKQWEAIKPAIDNRDSDTNIVSRTGIVTKARALKNLNSYKPKEGTDFLLIDEVQFFTPQDIDKLHHIAKDQDVTVFCYGLLLDSNGKRFPASDWLYKICNEKHRVEAVCEMPGCKKLATHHLRFDKNNNVVCGGDQVEVGANQYKSVCAAHWRAIYHKETTLAQILEQQNQKIK